TAVKVELDHDAVRGQTRAADATLHPPEQHDRIELGLPRIAEGPARAPAAQHVDDALELTPGRGQVVFRHAAISAGAPLDQLRALAAGQPAVEVVEVANAGEQLADD